MMMNIVKKNKKRSSFYPFISTVLIALVVFLGLTGCSNTDRSNPSLPRPPIKWPFAVQQAGTKIESEIQVIDYRSYIFNLSFIFDEHNQADRARVEKLVGNDMQSGGDSGIPTPLRLKINLIDAAGEKPILDQEFREVRLRSWGPDNFEKNIVDVKLKPGHYRVSIESLANAPELIGTTIFFTVRFYPKSSPIE